MTTHSPAPAATDEHVQRQFKSIGLEYLAVRDATTEALMVLGIYTEGLPEALIAQMCKRGFIWQKVKP